MSVSSETGVLQVGSLIIDIYLAITPMPHMMKQKRVHDCGKLGDSSHARQHTPV